MSSYIFRIGRQRGAHARHWQTTIPAAEFVAEGRGIVKPLPPLRQAVQWQGELESVAGGWRLAGSLALSLRRECSRCSGAMWWPLELDIVRAFPHQLTGTLLGRGADGPLMDDGRVAGQEDLDVMDLIDLLREEVWLAWQQFACCSDQCKGLCPVCGYDLNRGACSCSGVDAGHPFAALAGLKVT
ncbi:MAG: DUF177 domain-containing protein [Mariprofundales bacterium]|nr:DUF177 domain-containing protein [Mariprofundales bacterium]